MVKVLSSWLVGKVGFDQQGHVMWIVDVVDIYAKQWLRKKKFYLGLEKVRGICSNKFLFKIHVLWKWEFSEFQKLSLSEGG